MQKVLITDKTQQLTSNNFRLQLILEGRFVKAQASLRKRCTMEFGHEKFGKAVSDFPSQHVLVEGQNMTTKAERPFGPSPLLT